MGVGGHRVHQLIRKEYMGVGVGSFKGMQRQT